MRNTSEYEIIGICQNYLGKGHSIKTASSTDQRHVSLTLILDKTTECIRKGALIRCITAPPHLLLDEVTELGKPGTETDRKCLDLNKTFPNTSKMFMSCVKKGEGGSFATWSTLLRGCQLTDDINLDEDYGQM